MNLLYDVLEYFARFPERDAVIRMFNKGKSNYPVYGKLLDKIQNAPKEEHSLFPEIEDFIFDVTEETVIKKIDSIGGIFLFVDYGDIRTEELFPVKVRQNVFTLALTIAKRVNERDFDNIERLIIADEMYVLLQRIIEIMRKDTNPFMKRVTFPLSSTPAISRSVLQSVGWTVKFDLRNIS
ncbi:MAG: hypothetical protein ACLSDJ_08435 [Butyricimonas faecihominis]